MGALAVLTAPCGTGYTVGMDDNHDFHGVADMGAYRQNFTEAARQARERASIVVTPDQLAAYRYMARTAWERLRQEGRSSGLVWFDPELRVVPAAKRHHGLCTAELTTVSIGVVHEAYVDEDGKRRERVPPGNAQVSVQLPQEYMDGWKRWPALWVSDFDRATGPTDGDPYQCDRVDWHDPFR